MVIDMTMQRFFQIGIALAALCSASLAQAELIGSWSFERGEEPGIIKDMTGNGHDGTVTGEAHYVEGVSGTGLAFDGEAVYVEIANSSDDSPLSLTKGSYTITCWVKFNNLGGIQRIINKDNGENYAGGYALALTEEMIRLDTNHGKKHSINIAAIPANTWRFFAITYHQENGYRKVYMNGELVAMDQIGPEGMQSRPGDQLWFGAIPKYGQYLSGVLDEVRIYDEALSDAKISELVADPATDGAAR